MNTCFILYFSNGGTFLFGPYSDSRIFFRSRVYCRFLNMKTYECCNKFTGEFYWSNIFGIDRAKAYKAYKSEQFNGV